MKEVDKYIIKKKEWQEELLLLRKVLLAQDLVETIKWGSPVYTNDGKNIVGLSAFKNYVGLWFFQGGTLKDKANVLINAQEGKTSAMRQWRFLKTEEIDVVLIEKYVNEAIINQKKGNIIRLTKNTKPVLIPDLLKTALKNDASLAKNFEVFSLAKKREFAEYISEAKKDLTKQNRLTKIIPMIQNGIGLYDKYKNC